MRSILGAFQENRYFIALLILWCLLGIWLCAGVTLTFGMSEAPASIPSISVSVAFFAFVAVSLICFQVMALRNTLARNSFYARLPGLVFQVDHRGRIKFASDYGLDWFGASRSDDLRDHILDPTSLVNLRKDALTAKGDITESELSVTTKEGTERWLRVQMRALPPYTSDSRLDCIVWDITELIYERERRQESENRLRTLEKLSNEALFLHNEGKCIDANDAAERMFGYSRDELLNMTAADILSRETLPTVMENIQSGYDKPYEAVAICKNGESFPCEINGRNVVLDGKTVRLTSFSDITERKLAETQIRFQANHDALTSLPNRYLFMDRLTSTIKLAKRRRERFALMYIDLDGFKSLNDSCGHVLADKVLAEIAKRMEATLRDVDTVARIGGDEFTAILPGTETPEDARTVVEKLQKALSSQPIELDGKKAPCFVSASIGIALYPDHGENIDELMTAADEAMYHAKKSGKNTFRFATNKRSADS